MDPHHHHTPLHWGYSPSATQNTWIPPPTRKLKRAISESDCEDIYSEESSKEQTSPGESDSCQMMSRKKRRGVIEKKRRDRINSSLCELKRLVPSAFEKQGSAKLEKAEILQLTVDHLKSLNSKGVDPVGFDPQRFAMDYHIIGFRECASEVARYLVTIEGMDIQDPLRLRLMSHLQCFVAQRELSLKNSGTTTTGTGPSSIPGTGNVVGMVTSAVVNPISPNMGQSAGLNSNSHSNWMPSTPSYHHQTTHSQAYQMMSSTPYHHQNSYASQTAAHATGYVPNLPASIHQYDQYNNNHSGIGQQSTSTRAQGGNNATTTRANLTENYSQDNGNNRATASNNSSSADDGSSRTRAGATSASDSSTAPIAEHGPTYTDLSSVAHRASANNYYGSIHYPIPATSEPYHHSLSSYSIDAAGLNNNSNSLLSDPARGYNNSNNNVSNGGAKPYRPWGAEMAY